MGFTQKRQNFKKTAGLNKVEKKQVSSIIKKTAETKFNSVAISQVPTTTPSLVNLLPNISQGNDITARDGNKISLHSIRIRGRAILLNNDVLRLLIVQHKDLAPTASDILATGDHYNFVNYTNSNVEVLYDKFYPVTSDNYGSSNTRFKIDLSLKDLKRVRKTLKYEGSGASQPANNIQMFLLSKTVSGGLVEYTSSVFWKDL